MFTKPLTVTSTPATLLSLLQTAGYTGNTRVNGGTLYNSDAGVECYIIFHSSGSSAPTGTDGMTFGPASPSKVWVLHPNCDLTATWLYAASSITVRSEVH